MTPAIRRGGVEDAVICREIYIDAVLNGTAPDYSPEQSGAWAHPASVMDWLPQRLSEGITWIAETGQSAHGFLTVTKDGHLDLFFVRPEVRGTGVADALYREMMVWAADKGHSRLTTHASHFARRFLTRRGWSTIAGETTTRLGVELQRWEMAWSGDE